MGAGGGVSKDKVLPPLCRIQLRGVSDTRRVEGRPAPQLWPHSAHLVLNGGWSRVCMCVLEVEGWGERKTNFKYNNILKRRKKVINSPRSQAF